MTAVELIALDLCPSCGEHLMKVPSTGLVSCLAWLKFKACRWHVRIDPFELDLRRNKMSRKDKILMEQQARIDRMIEEANG